MLSPSTKPSDGLEYTPSNAGWTDNTPTLNVINFTFGTPFDGNPYDERSGLDIVRESSLMTSSMSRRNALRAKAIFEASKVGRGYRNFQTPNQPENLHTPMTDAFGRPI